MKKVFMGGSKSLKTLSPAALSALNGYLAEGTEFLVGDCAGADCAFMVWDGRSKGTFLNILEMLKREKPVSVLLSRSSQVIPVTSYAELEPYLSKG